MSPTIYKLLEKRRRSVSDHLHDHIRDGRVQASYVSVKGKQAGESHEAYARRLREAYEDYQFVAVTVHGKVSYVAFGVPGPIVTEFGKFQVVPAEVVGGVWGVHHFMFYPDLEQVRAQAEVCIRIDSGCLSGMVLGDTTCDCKEQLDIAKRRCAENGSGLVVEIPGHDGRGWGDLKMANQRLMDELGVTTVEAARMFYGHDSIIDQRSYDECVTILLALGFSTQHAFELSTNNPTKVQAFVENGMRVSHTKSIVPEKPNGIVQKNLDAKSKSWNHNFLMF